MKYIINDKKKLLIISAVAVAVIAAIVILVAALSNMPHGKGNDSAKEPAGSEVQTESPADENTENTEEAAAENTEGVQIEIPVEDLGKLVDSVDEEYKSFEVQPVDSADFFLGKNLRLVATFKDHEMTYRYEQNITAMFSDSALVMNYKDSEGNDQALANYVYAAPSEAFTSPGGRKFAVIAFGDHEITEENKEFSTDCFMLIKMRDDIDMYDAKSDTYVMLIESEMTDTYELFKVE